MSDIYTIVIERPDQPIRAYLVSGRYDALDAIVLERLVTRETYGDQPDGLDMDGLGSGWVTINGRDYQHRAYVGNVVADFEIAGGDQVGSQDERGDEMTATFEYTIRTHNWKTNAWDILDTGFVFDADTAADLFDIGLPDLQDIIISTSYDTFEESGTRTVTYTLEAPESTDDYDWYIDGYTDKWQLCVEPIREGDSRLPIAAPYTDLVKWLKDHEDGPEWQLIVQPNGTTKTYLYDDAGEWLADFTFAHGGEFMSSEIKETTVYQVGDRVIFDNACHDEGETLGEIGDGPVKHENGRRDEMFTDTELMIGPVNTPEKAFARQRAGQTPRYEVEDTREPDGRRWRVREVWPDRYQTSEDMFSTFFARRDDAQRQADSYNSAWTPEYLDSIGYWDKWCPRAEAAA